MGLNVGEANAASVIIRCILHDDAKMGPAEKAAAKILAEAVNKRLLAGPTPAHVEQYWPNTEERPDPSALLYVGDGEQCEACDWMEQHRPDHWRWDACPYHAGMEQGRALFAEAIAALNENPDLLTGVLVDHERNQAIEQARRAS